MLNENQKYLEAISYYDRTLDKVEYIMKTNLNPFNVGSMNYFLASNLLKKGNSYYYFKEYSEAIINYNRAIQINPEDAHLYFNRGLAYAKLQNTEGAFNDFDRAAKIDPEFTKAIDNREIIRQNLKK
ncbi:MAG: tetratricopeptide repeat protein [Prochloraceae cyanobacterium]|nr:tetratricopeptide repeat protein [Prochloraceae cyanobacterium]